MAARPGAIVWADLTVPDAERVRDFYRAVTGWRPEPVGMGSYDDYSMLPADSEEPVAGVCHARGLNAGLPAQWLVYVQVADLDAALERCARLGGQVLRGPRGLGEQRFAVIQDPAGAVMALVGA